MSEEKVDLLEKIDIIYNEDEPFDTFEKLLKKYVKDESKPADTRIGEVMRALQYIYEAYEYDKEVFFKLDSKQELKNAAEFILENIVSTQEVYDRLEDLIQSDSRYYKYNMEDFISELLKAICNDFDSNLLEPNNKDFKKDVEEDFNSLIYEFKYNEEYSQYLSDIMNAFIAKKYQITRQDILDEIESWPIPDKEIAVLDIDKWRISQLEYEFIAKRLSWDAYKWFDYNFDDYIEGYENQLLEAYGDPLYEPENIDEATVQEAVKEVAKKYNTLNKFDDDELDDIGERIYDLYYYGKYHSYLKYNFNFYNLEATNYKDEAFEMIKDKDFWAKILKDFEPGDNVFDTIFDVKGYRSGELFYNSILKLFNMEDNYYLPVNLNDEEIQ